MSPDAVSAPDGATLGEKISGALTGVEGELSLGLVLVLVGYAVLTGASLASFACVVGERRVRGEGINGRSHCACGRPLRLRENIPVLGWALARGRARCCGVKIPAAYALTEAGVGAAGGLAMLAGLSLSPARGLGLIVLVVGVSLVLTARWSAKVERRQPESSAT